MGFPLNNSSSSVNRLNTMFLHHLMGRLEALDSDNKEEELEYKNEVDNPRSYQYEGLRAINQEKSRIEAEVVHRILNGKAHTLKPNSGETVMIRESNIVVGFHVDKEEWEYIAWEWHGHISRYTEEHQYSLEYISGNYFQRIVSEECQSRLW
ncbi:uncharacterized protein LOC131614728 [Vicia villosa]|uniref:uncharacterized protein LOC131614728 n=1 Tax=Vicia villosa TaxID=3911 RepID=UPI00273B878A|nr:uncharacterized protein LOC131614728 [Vicia villosa]